MAHVDGVFENTLQKSISDSRLLVVGAGGIGCELLKNIVLTGFKDIEVIDLDTIDVSNLNRQFLFQKQHVGKSKSSVARESALRFAPDAKIKAYHDSIMKEDYGVNFYKNFDLCLNALDNRAARNHVNRMCLAANLPLVESGTAGYLGQVTVIIKGKTECYECQPKPHQKTFPGCTIRNTPSEPIHCIVWAKHLFNQLFGEDDPDQDVSPDTEDPEQAGDQAGEAATNNKGKEDGNVERKSTKQWAQECEYATPKLFQKFFNDDIKYLLSMDKLWTKRRPPTALDWDCLPDTTDKSAAATTSNLADQKVWSVAECANQLGLSIAALKSELKERGDELVWDKDTPAHLDFVTACANIRMYIFNITQKSRFEVKSMAGNIIPAIATTNAVIAGCIVMEAIKILNKQVEKCKTVYLRRQPNPRKKILVTESLEPPNPKCYVCAEKPEVNVMLNLETTTIKMLEERVLKASLNMVAPDVEIEGKGVILISSEEGETECNNEKLLKDFGLKDGSILSCDDFLQNYNLKMFLYHADKLEDGKEFIITGDKEQLQPKEDVKEAEPEPEVEKNSGNKESAIDVEAEDVEVVANGDRKRPAEESNGQPLSKKPKVDDDDVVICDADEIDAIKLKSAAASGAAAAVQAGQAQEEGVICID